MIRPLAQLPSKVLPSVMMGAVTLHSSRRPPFLKRKLAIYAQRHYRSVTSRQLISFLPLTINQARRHQAVGLKKNYFGVMRPRVQTPAWSVRRERDLDTPVKDRRTFRLGRLETTSVSSPISQRVSLRRIPSSLRNESASTTSE